MIHWINKRFQNLSVTIYPYRWWLLISWVTGVIGANALNQDFEKLSELVAIIVAWPFYLWFVVVLWGHPDKAEYKKTPVSIMFIYGTSAVVGIIALSIVTILGLYSAYVLLINS